MKLYLGILIIFMILVAGCMNATSNTQKTVAMAQPTVEPPLPVAKSGLDVIVVPNPTQIQGDINITPNPLTTLVYGIYSSNGGYVTIRNSSNATSVVTVVTTEIPITTIVITPIPTTIVPTQTTPVPTTTSTPVPTTTSTPAPTPTQNPGNTLDGVQIFPRDHIWNAPVNSLSVDIHSTDYINSMGVNSFIGGYIGFPINIVDSSVPHVMVTSWGEGAWDADKVPAPFPENTLLETASDRHLIIVDRDEKTVYEFYHASKASDGTWSCDAQVKWDLTGYRILTDGYGSADAAGMTMLPGLLRYDEVNSGTITHALRLVVPQSQNAHIYPATHHDGKVADPKFPPMGQRFRLKASFDTSGYPLQTKTILEALKIYGMMITDSGAGAGGEIDLSVVPDPRWNYNTLIPLHQVKISDFEAVNITPLIINKNSAQVRTGIIPIPTLTLTPISGETFGAIASNPTGSPIGGGSGYNKIVLKSSAKYIVSTKIELLDAFKVAKPGEIIFVNGDAIIDMTGTNSNIIPDGIILASDRGQGGSQGGLIKRYRSSGITWSQTSCFVIGNNVRITGLRFDGGEIIRDQLTDQLSPPIMPLAMISARGMTGIEIDNNEMYGFSYTAIELDSSGYWNNNIGDAWVHHNNIHHCQARGYGYGIQIAGGRVLIEANVFDYMRHAVAASGLPGESYEYRYNHHLGGGYPIGASVCDVHAYPPGDYEDENSIAGYEYKIHHNTFERPERPDMSDNYAIGIRARPEKGVYIDHNIFNYNSASGEPVFYRACNHDGKMIMTNNLIGYDNKVPILVTGEVIMYTYPSVC